MASALLLHTNKPISRGGNMKNVVVRILVGLSLFGVAQVHAQVQAPRRVVGDIRPARPVLNLRTQVNLLLEQTTALLEDVFVIDRTDGQMIPGQPEAIRNLRLLKESVEDLQTYVQGNLNERSINNQILVVVDKHNEFLNTVDSLPGRFELEYSIQEVMESVQDLESSTQVASLPMLVRSLERDSSDLLQSLRNNLPADMNRLTPSQKAALRNVRELVREVGLLSREVNLRGRNIRMIFRNVEVRLQDALRSLRVAGQLMNVRREAQRVQRDVEEIGMYIR